MSIGTQERTQPRLGLYYAIMVGAFAASITALLALNWTAFVVIAGVSTVAVIIAAMRLGVAGEQVVVEEPPHPPFSLRQLLVQARARWRAIAAWCVATVGVFAAVTATKPMPPEWQDRAILLLISGVFCQQAHYGVSELRSVVANLSNPELDRKRLVLRAILAITLIVAAAAFFYYVLQRDLPANGQGIAMIAAIGVFLLARRVADKPAPTPRAPSQPAAE